MAVLERRGVVGSVHSTSSSRGSLSKILCDVDVDR